jgi:putative ABC transport system substrate-binding protein
MRRREFVKWASGAVVWPLTARAQQPAMPVIGYLTTRGATDDLQLTAAFHQGLKEIGFVEGQNVAIEYRWADGQYDRLPALASDLVGRQVSLIFAGPLPATLAAKAATSTIPIVFANGNDPVAYGLVASLNRPAGNVTGVSFLVNLLMAKQLEVLHQTVPKAATIAFLVNPNNPNAGSDTKQVLSAADTLGRKILTLEASTADDIEQAFSMMTRQQVGGLLIHADAFFTSRNEQLVALTTRDAIPAIFYFRQFAASGGLMSYGASIRDAYQTAGSYAGRILKGEKPADLSVQQATKVELFINLKTAKALGITMPTGLLVRADEVIE